MTDQNLGRPRPTYDALAAVYDRWLSGDEAAQPCLRFYLDELRGEAGPVLELGAGTGRITRALAAAGTTAVGLDLSARMLAHGTGHSRAWLAVCGRFEELPFASTVFPVVVLPMRTIGHLTDAAARRAAFAQVARVLRPGGRFLLDHYQLDRAWAESHDGLPRLMYSGPGERGAGTALLVWDRYDYDFAAQLLHCTVRIDRVGPGPTRVCSSTVEFDFRWYGVEEIVQLALDTGFAVDACYGDFDRTPFGQGAEHMVFVLRRR